MNDAMVLMSEGFRRAVREVTIFIESSRRRDHKPTSHSYTRRDAETNWNTILLALII